MCFLVFEIKKSHESFEIDLFRKMYNIKGVISKISKPTSIIDENASAN